IRIEWPTALAACSCADSAAACPVSCEPGPCLRGRMRAAIVKRRYLDVLDVATAIRPFVFQSEIGEVDMAVEERQIMLVRPLLDFSRIAIWPTVGIGTVAISVVKKLLIVALELVVERDAMNSHVVLLKPLGRPQVSRIELRVVRQFSRPHLARIERLPWSLFRCAVTFEQFAPALR